MLGVSNALDNEFKEKKICNVGSGGLGLGLVTLTADNK